LDRQTSVQIAEQLEICSQLSCEVSPWIGISCWVKECFEVPIWLTWCLSCEWKIPCFRKVKKIIYLELKIKNIAF